MSEIPQELLGKSYWNDNGLVLEYEESGEIKVPYFLLFRCNLCGTYRGFTLTPHHLSYIPEKITLICDSCHNKIHNQDGWYDDLEPEMKRRKAIEKRKKPLRNVRSSKLATPGEYEIKEKQRRRHLRAKDYNE